MHDEKYSLPALCAAVAAHTAPGGTAYLMCARSRPGVSALAEKLVDATPAGACEVSEETLSVMNSFGEAELVLVTYARAPA